MLMPQPSDRYAYQHRCKDMLGSTLSHCLRLQLIPGGDET